MNSTFLALDALLTRYLNLYSDHESGLPLAVLDADWSSECIVKPADSKSGYYWRPTKRTQAISFSDLETALEVTFPEDLYTFYGSFWSNGLCVERHDINFNLIQIWNEDDEKMLKENLLGHVFAKIKGKLPLSYFIGCTNGDEVICLEHETGYIVLEKPGYQAHKVLAENLESFLISLQPNMDNYSG
jgi:SecY interacting protein Syd